MSTVYVDLETQYLHSEVPGGWGNIPGFGFALAVTDCNRLEHPDFTVNDSDTRIWKAGGCHSNQDTVNLLVRFLEAHDRVVGYNLLDFDYTVLHAYVPDTHARLAHKTLDLCADIRARAGYRVSLDHVARATFGRGKTGKGEDAPGLWKAGKMDDLAAYCQGDVALTRALHQFGARYGYVLVDVDMGQDYDTFRKVPVQWT